MTLKKKKKKKKKEIKKEINGARGTTETLQASVRMLNVDVCDSTIKKHWRKTACIEGLPGDVFTLSKKKKKPA